MASPSGRHVVLLKPDNLFIGPHREMVSRYRRDALRRRQTVSQNPAPLLICFKLKNRRRHLLAGGAMRAGGAATARQIDSAAKLFNGAAVALRQAMLRKRNFASAAAAVDLAVDFSGRAR
jgi:hypothetical protein